METDPKQRGVNSPSMQRLHGRSDYAQTGDGGSELDNFHSPPQPPFDSEEMRGTMQAILADNIGNYVVIEFLIGTGEILRKQGCSTWWAAATSPCTMSPPTTSSSATSSR